jgi:N-acetylglutamate synthase-like GNAT family acetyltransferase
MTTTTLAIEPRKEVLAIKNSTDLDREINRLKVEVKAQEIELKARMHSIPQEALKFTVVSVLPAFLAKGVAMKTFGILRNAVGLFSTLRSHGKGGSLKQSIVESAKKIGLSTAFKAAFNLFKNRKRKL